MHPRLLAVALALLAGAAVPVAWAQPAAPSPPPDLPPQKWESPPFSLVPRGFQKDPHLDLNIITEVTPAGRVLPKVNSRHPVYYGVSDGGMMEQGDIVAGEKAPKPGLLHDAMVKALRVNGYLPADAAHPPTQWIHFNWGSFNQLTFTGQNDPLEVQNLGMRANLVGGPAFASDMLKAYLLGGLFFQSFRMKDPHNDWLVTLASGNLYFIAATSFDYAASKEGKLVTLWRTKMTTDSNGLTMDESVTTLVTGGGPYFGRETPPVRLDRPAIKEGHVEVGTPTIKN